VTARRPPAAPLQGRTQEGTKPARP
jgi:hypothetical protein